MKIHSITAPAERSCTGCGACSAACPCDAITMGVNPDGFLSPELHDDKCVDCGLCQKVCYKYLPPAGLPSLAGGRVLGMYARDREVQSSTTSGGFAYELSRWGVRRGYGIFGTLYDYGTDRARAVLVTREEDLHLLKGSKYLHGATQEALSALLVSARRDPAAKFICFGTPCQIFGLRRLVEQKKLKNEFILVDLFCHGVPSYLVWDAYVAEKRARLGRLSEVNFRYKGNGWHQYTIRLSGARGRYTQYAYRDTFYRYFFDNVVLNTSCFTCYVRKAVSAADLRIGDFLGKRYEHRDDGISAVMPLTPKGDEVLRLLQADGGGMVTDAEWDAPSCLEAQSTHDYPRLALRNAVISALRGGQDIHTVQRWYFSRFALPYRLRSRMKQAATLLPGGWVAKVRRAFRLLERAR